MKYLQPTIYAMIMLLVLPVLASATPDVDIQRYNPTPAQPGDLLNIEFTLSNLADEPMQAVQLEVLESNTILPETRNSLRVNNIPGYSTYHGTLPVRVRADAPAGESLVRVRVRTQTDDWQEQTIAITIEPTQKGVVVSQVQINPEMLTPAQPATISFVIENNANTYLREVSTQLELEDTPFVPVQSTARNRVGDLPTGQSSQVSYQLVAQPDAQAGIYRVPINMQFLDREGNTITQEDVIGIPISTTQHTAVHVNNVEQTTSGAEVSVRIVNKGLSEIKFVEAQVQPKEQYNIPAQQQTAYLGNIDSDDWQTIRFSVESQAQTVEIPLTYTYRDVFGTEYTNEQSLTVQIPQAQESGFGFGSILVLAVLIGGGYFWYKKRKQEA